MNSDADGANAASGAGQEADEPIRALLAQERETSPDFVARVRRKIHRRAAASQFATFSWRLPQVVLVEMGGILWRLFTAASGKKDSQP